MIFMFSKQLESITGRRHMHLINDPITDKIALVWQFQSGVGCRPAASKISNENGDDRPSLESEESMTERAVAPQ